MTRKQFNRLNSKLNTTIVAAVLFAGAIGLIHYKDHSPDTDSPSITEQIGQSDLPSTYCACKVTTKYPNKDEDIDVRDCGSPYQCDGIMLSHCRGRIRDTTIDIFKSDGEKPTVEQTSDPREPIAIMFPDQDILTIIQCTITEPTPN